MNRRKAFKVKSKLWLYPGPAAWHFLSVPKKETAEIKKTFSGLERGFGSFPVQVTIGKTSWKTSIFPDSKTKTFLLPVKTAVRKKEKMSAGKMLQFSVEILA